MEYEHHDLGSGVSLAFESGNSHQLQPGSLFLMDTASRRPASAISKASHVPPLQQSQSPGRVARHWRQRNSGELRRPRGAAWLAQQLGELRLSQQHRQHVAPSMGSRSSATGDSDPCTPLKVPVAATGLSQPALLASGRVNTGSLLVAPAVTL